MNIHQCKLFHTPDEKQLWCIKSNPCTSACAWHCAAPVLIQASKHMIVLLTQYQESNFTLRICTIFVFFISRGAHMVSFTLLLNAVHDMCGMHRAILAAATVCGT